MQRWTFLMCASAVLAGTMAVSTTSIIPPTFDEMVSKADVIFLGQAVDDAGQRGHEQPRQTATPRRRPGGFVVLVSPPGLSRGHCGECLHRR